MTTYFSKLFSRIITELKQQDVRKVETREHDDKKPIKEFDPEIYFSFSKGGFDHLLKLSKLMSQEKIKLEFNNFRRCHQEILIMVSDDLRKIVKQ